MPVVKKAGFRKRQPTPLFLFSVQFNRNKTPETLAALKTAR